MQNFDFPTGDAPGRFGRLAEEELRRWLDHPGRTAADHLAGRGAVGEFEAALRGLIGVPHCLATNSATNGLLALALACDLRGAEVITTPVSYGATWAPFEQLGARLVFARVKPGCKTIDPGSIAALITPRTRAVLAADWFEPHDTLGVREVCAEHGLLYLADASRAFGLRARGDFPASSKADAWVYSFGPGKRLSCGEGGAIMTRNEPLYHRLVALTQHPRRYRREVQLRGATDRQPLNARMHPFAALLGLAQLGSRVEPSTVAAHRGRTGPDRRSKQ